MTTKSQQLQVRVTPAQKAALKRFARRAGLDISSYVLSRVLPPALSRFHEIVRALREEDDHRFALAALNDFLTGLAPAEFREAVADVELKGLSPFLQNYVAAMVEQTAIQKSERPPAWAGDVPPLEGPHFAVPFSSLRPHLLRASPVAFKRRNIFVDSTVGDRV
ncbi:MAG: plasmid mobilization protein [Gemmatimonadota bacterium]